MKTVLFLAVIFVLAACSSDDSPTQPEPKPRPDFTGNWRNDDFDVDAGTHDYGYQLYQLSQSDDGKVTGTWTWVYGDSIPSPGCVGAGCQSPWEDTIQGQVDVQLYPTRLSWYACGKTRGTHTYNIDFGNNSRDSARVIMRHSITSYTADPDEIKVKRRWFHGLTCDEVPDVNDLSVRFRRY